MSFDPFRVRVAPNGSLNNPNYVFQAAAVGFGKIVETVAVDVQYAKHFVSVSEYRHNNLRPGGGAACNMAREFIDIGNDDSCFRRESVATNSSVETDARAGDGPLKRTKYEFAVLRKIETNPKRIQMFP
jgi:hypothetical protein